MRCNVAPSSSPWPVASRTLGFTQQSIFAPFYIVALLLWHSIQSRLLDPARLPPLLRSIRAAVFPNNAPGTPSLVAPSSDEELAALRRRCASAVWALVPKMVGKLYFGSATPFSESSSSAQPRPTSTNAETKATSGNADKTKTSSVHAQHVRSGPPITSVTSSSSDFKSNSSSATTPVPGSSNRSAAKADPLSSAPRLEASDHARFAQLGSSNEGNVTSAANSRDPVKATTTATAGTIGASNAFIKPSEAVWGASRATAANTGSAGSVISKEKPLSAAMNAGVDGLAPEATPLQCHEEDDRILSEIETGILDVFSDAYCNKHLMYGVLELILVRLMPELAERGVIDLWEERLS
ncbi:hypothetical protein PG984_002263 [Apiospora sp. TS-2023a]